MSRARLQMSEYRDAILRGDRAMLARAITLVESTLDSDQYAAGELLEALLPHTGKSLRIGVTGAPGVGKSTFIETFGAMLLEVGKKVAVLTIDPTSPRTGGSILGDKTRMPGLARDTRVFIRPTPSGTALGGVASATRETILLCEAAGFDTILVESVGTGQSEVALRSMVDFFLLLVLPGSGDELQGIKKGIVEMADAVAVTKADGDQRAAAQRTQADYRRALHMLPGHPSGWTPPVLTCSARESVGLDAIWSSIVEYEQRLTATGVLAANRRTQQAAWFREYFTFLLTRDPARFPQVLDEEATLSRRVESETLFPRRAAQQLLEIYYRAIRAREH